MVFMHACIYKICVHINTHLHTQESLTAYCLSEDCAFAEYGYSTCGFEKFQCNPVREGI